MPHTLQQIGRPKNTNMKRLSTKHDVQIECPHAMCFKKCNTLAPSWTNNVRNIKWEPKAMVPLEDHNDHKRYLSQSNYSNVCKRCRASNCSNKPSKTITSTLLKWSRCILITNWGMGLTEKSLFANNRWKSVLAVLFLQRTLTAGCSVQ